MKDLKILRSSSELRRLIIVTIIYVSIGTFGLNSVSGRRILKCDRSSGIVNCQLTTKQLLAEQSVTEFDAAKLQKAIVKSKETMITRGRTTFQATLITTHGDFWMSSMDNGELKAKQLLVDQVNTFLLNKQVPSLKIESSYSSLFWIGTGICSCVLALLIFVTWIIFSSNVLNMEFKSWEENHPTGEHHRLIEMPKPDKLISPKIDDRFDS